MLSIHTHAPRASLFLGKPGEAGPVADGMEPREGKCIKVTGIKWADQN